MLEDSRGPSERVPTDLTGNNPSLALRTCAHARLGREGDVAAGVLSQWPMLAPRYGDKIPSTESRQTRSFASKLRGSTAKPQPLICPNHNLGSSGLESIGRVWTDERANPGRDDLQRSSSMISLCSLEGSALCSGGTMGEGGREE